MPESEDGTPEEQAAFMKELENFYREKAVEFKPPKFYGQPLNCLKYDYSTCILPFLHYCVLPLLHYQYFDKTNPLLFGGRLWRAVIKLGGYDRVSMLWLLDIIIFCTSYATHSTFSRLPTLSRVSRMLFSFT